jgi:hypothetical protein
MTRTLVASEVNEFLRFKRLLLPGPCKVGTAISGPGQPSRRPEQAGLASTPAWGELAAAINLGDRKSSLILLNLVLDQLVARQPNLEPTASLIDRVRAFLKAHPTRRWRTRDRKQLGGQS